eukprot:TRINITY_DN17462_c0_g1_i1.p1 TRINITY_DN17462_c0_g1~~TRINITY_DN17462_c0_g1_i1.p1  ORF type:complete len:295 (+),score=76.87 TRINITY_DN17462_c0_g1_i1:3-887(+)
MCIRDFFFLMIRRPPRSTQSRSSAASDVYKRQIYLLLLTISALSEGLNYPDYDLFSKEYIYAKICTVNRFGHAMDYFVNKDICIYEGSIVVIMANYLTALDVKCGDAPQCDPVALAKFHLDRQPAPYDSCFGYFQIFEQLGLKYHSVVYDKDQIKKSLENQELLILYGSSEIRYFLITEIDEKGYVVLDPLHRPFGARITYVPFEDVYDIYRFTFEPKTQSSVSTFLAQLWLLHSLWMMDYYTFVGNICKSLSSVIRAFFSKTTRAPGQVLENCLLYTSPSPRDGLLSRMPSSA